MAIVSKDVGDTQYQMIGARRQHYDNLIWQTPMISLTAQAFLFTIALGGGDKPSRAIASALAFITAVASAQLLSKHRHFEVYYARLLQSIETARQLPTVSERPPSGEGFSAMSAYSVWRFVLWAFAAAALMAGIKAWM